MKTIEVQSVFGVIEAYDSDLITDQIIGYGNHTRPEFAFATCLLDYRDNVFDIGAHIGTFSLAVRQKQAYQGKLLAVEGNNETFNVLERNLARFGGAETKTLNAFVGGGGEYSYQLPEGNTGAGRLSKGPETKNSCVLPVVSLDELAEKFFVPTFIKLDIEGFEYKALSESKLVSNANPIVYMEINANLLMENGATLIEVDHFFREIGYRFFSNIGARNAAHDIFHIAELHSLYEYRPFFDVACVPPHSHLLKPLSKLCRNRLKNPSKLRKLAKRIFRASRLGLDH